MRGVSIRPGATQFTVTPLGPTSRESVFSQPTSPGRIAFERARCAVGSFAVSDVIATMRPASLCSRCGRQRRTSRTAGREEELERRLEAVVGHVAGLAGGRAARVPDEDVDAAERLECLRDEPLEICDVGDVAAHRERADAVGVALQLLAAPREHGHVRAFLGERLRGGEAEAGRGPADNRRPAAKTEIHAVGR